MRALYSLQDGDHPTRCWGRGELSEKLKGVAALNRSTTWLQADLRTTPRNAFWNLIWKIVRSSSFLRQFIFHVDLEESKSTLIALDKIISTDDDAQMREQFYAAVRTFNALFQKHTTNIMTPPAPIATAPIVPDTAVPDYDSVSLHFQSSGGGDMNLSANSVRRRRIGLPQT